MTEASTGELKNESEELGCESGTTRSLVVPRGTARAYAITSPSHELYFEQVCTLLEMLEHPIAKAAPVGSLLVRDTDDGSRGVLVAERVLDGGWLLKDPS